MCSAAPFPSLSLRSETLRDGIEFYFSVLNFGVDDGGATPVQDERDSGSDGEDEGNEQHSGSENGSVEHHSEVLPELYLDKDCSSIK